MPQKHCCEPRHMHTGDLLRPDLVGGLVLILSGEQMQAGQGGQQGIQVELSIRVLQVLIL